jgi:hypothetical protein
VGVFAGPDVSESGLVLALDAGNLKSYSGSGTTWTDLSRTGNNGTLTNGPTYNSSNGGSIVFDGINDYVYTPLNIDANPNTLCSWFKPSVVNSANGSAIMATDNGGWDKGFEINSNVFAIHVGNSLTMTSIPAVINTWYYCCLSYTSSSMTFYVNGVNLWSAGSPGSTSGSTLEIGRANYLSGSGSRFFTGNIAQVSIYNRALTAAEIQQNFNSTRGRYGI